MYTQPGPALVGHPTFCVRYKGNQFYPESMPKMINVRTGFDAGKDIELGVPVRAGDTIESAPRCTRSTRRRAGPAAWSSSSSASP